MKRQPISIHFRVIFRGVLALFLVLCSEIGFSQGFNNNEWIFGYCPTATNNSYLSFGKGTEPVVKELPRAIVIGSQTSNVDNNAVMIDPITGQILFFTNGILVYNYDNEVIQGAPTGINGINNGVRQAVAIAAFNYAPEGDRIFYIFYRTPAGQLHYAIVDMNAPGGALGNQPPLGAVTTLNQPIGAAAGAIAVVKTANSPNYLVSYDGANLVVRRIETTQGSFTETASIPLGFTPKAIIFKESTQQLILIPTNPGDDIVLIELNTSNGSLGASTTVQQSGGAGEIEGVELSPDGNFLYFSRGNQLFRISTNDLGGTPVSIPLANASHQLFDIRVGPDGRLYYIYQEVAGGPQLIGRVNNPNEEELVDLIIEEDPFNGVDFCGTVFPQFAPNQDIDPTVDFTWEPEEPCANNPVQLTSQITPLNYRPVSFEWTFNPPLTNEDGQPIDIDFNQEHLLIPEEATTEESLSVTLTVRFADGTTRTVDKTINLRENDLEANFTPQDTTICAPNCLDLMPLLEVQQGGGGQGGGAGGAGGSGGNYEYFWSNKRDQGWGPEAPNQVCQPGLYWALAREVGSECYVYAEIRVKVWDLQDQSNGVWYFGDGAGLDFNPDPNNPNQPIPRAVSHPNTIPAGTATISDETGQVLFYTDGQTVWDLNGNIMENGANIGGSNQTSQGVIAVPVPQNPTIYYVFTTQSVGNGSSEVRFSVVDLAGQNQTGAGSVTTNNNFLFSPATEQVAALATGATNWVLFHELGNNTFRAYPLTQFGIGQPVFSSVGSRHGFGAGVGTMKFSPDGSQVAITINDGGCSRLEIFDFDVQTGRLTEYALVDLGCTNEDIYGLEFSNDGNRIFVSYRSGGGKIEEFLIKNPGSENGNPSPCGTCFNNASSRQAREQCILTSSVRNTVSTAGPFGAIQIGPDGQIYVARPGQSVITSILPGTGCSPSVYNPQGIPLVAGTSMNLGLPSFARQSGSNIPEPSLEGPERLCLDPTDGAEAEFGGGGEPDIDSYFWTIIHEDGTADVTDFGGPGDENQNYIHNFRRPGLYTVSLRVDRCGDADYFEASIQVRVVASPEITLPDDAVLCVGSPVSLTAIDGYDPADGLYDFEWRNAAGFQVGDINSNTILVDAEDIYTVTVSFRVPTGQDPDTFDRCPATRSIFVGPAFEFDINLSQDEVCNEDVIVTFAPNTPIVGEWLFELQGVPGRTSIGEFFELELNPLLMLPAAGTYNIIFVTEDPLVPGCLIEKVTEIIVHPLPFLDIVILSDSDCVAEDGSFELTARTVINTLTIEETGQVFSNIAAGTTLPVFDNLAPGIYTLTAVSEFGCVNVQSAIINNLNADPSLGGFGVDVEDEVCGPTGILDGKIVIRLSAVPGSLVGIDYRLIREGDGAVFRSPLSTVATGDPLLFEIEVPHGVYSVELIDATDCPIPFDRTVSVGRKFQVDFSVPANVVACELFRFTPTAVGIVDFELRAVGSTLSIPAEADGSYVLNSSGSYVLIGIDPAGNACPRERTFNVSINSAVQFNLVGPLVDCEVGVSYEVNLVGVGASDVFIIWKDASGSIVGRDLNFFPRSTGDYTLEVQPRNAGLCPSNEVSFSVTSVLAQVDFTVEVDAICSPLVPATIRLEGDYDQDTVIEWFRITGPTATPLNQFNNLDEIEVDQEGIYEVVLSDALCELGRRRVQVRRATGIAPILQELYTICAVENVSALLDPGQYSAYSWLLDGVEVATTPTFTPTLPGNYRLEVTDEVGCIFISEFEVVEDCRLLVRIPDAMRPNDPSRQFVVYANAFVDNLEVAIYNRWGELIFYCQTNNIPANQAVCTWDGVYRGQTVPVGTYAVVLRFSSEQQSITQTQRSALLVIE